MFIFWQYPSHSVLALRQWKLAQVLAVQMHKIENVITQTVRLTLRNRLLQIGETGGAALVADDDLAVEQSGLHGQLG